MRVRGPPRPPTYADTRSVNSTNWLYDRLPPARPSGSRLVETKEGGASMRTWARNFCLSLFLVFAVIAGLQAPAWANSELHPGGRLFLPLWDVSTPNRETFIILTREAMREGASIQRVENEWHISGDPGKCLPREI